MKETIDYALNQVVDIFAALYGSEKVEIDANKLLEITKLAKERIYEDLELDKVIPTDISIEDNLRNIYILKCLHTCRYGDDAYVSLHCSEQDASKHVETAMYELCCESDKDDDHFEYEIKKETIDISKLELHEHTLDKLIAIAANKSGSDGPDRPPCVEMMLS